MGFCDSCRQPRRTVAWLVVLIALAAAAPAASGERAEPLALPGAGLEASLARPEALGGPWGPQSARPSEILAVGPRTGVFSRDHLEPKVVQQLRRIQFPVPDFAPELDALHRDRVDTLGRRAAERGFRKALKSYLLEETSLGRLLDLGNGERHGSGGAAARTRSFDVGFIGAAPALIVERHTLRGTLRLRVNARGEVGLGIRPGFAGLDTRISLRADPAERACRLTWRVQR